MMPAAIPCTYFGYTGREAQTGKGGLLTLKLLSAMALLLSLIGRLLQIPILEISKFKQRLVTGD